MKFRIGRFLYNLIRRGKSIEGSDRIISQYNKGINSLSDGNFIEAQDLLAYLFPVHGPISLDYALYAFEFAIGFPELLKKDTRSPLIAIKEVFEAIKKNYHTEYKNLLKWGKLEAGNLIKQMDNADIYRKLIKDHEISRIHNKFEKDEKVVPQLLVDEYKNRYEIDYTFELLANLFAIYKGDKFSKQPLKKRYKNKNIIDGNGSIRKGLAVGWLAENAPNDTIKGLIKDSYDSKVRNTLSGHNSYTFNSSSNEYISLKGNVRFSKEKIITLNNNLNSLQRYCYLEKQTLYFEDYVDEMELHGLDNIGYLDYRIIIKNKEVDRVLLFQYWANFSLRNENETPNIINFYPAPVKGKENVVCVSLGRTMFWPYDLRIIANQQTLDGLKLLLKKDKVKLSVISLAPPMSPFKEIHNNLDYVYIYGQKMLILDGLDKEVAVKKTYLQKLIIQLENTSLLNKYIKRN